MRLFAVVVVTLSFMACTGTEEPIGDPCGPGLELCGDKCANLQTDFVHCGGCNQECTPGQLCENGGCVLSCPPNMTDCSGQCVNTTVDPNHCNACNAGCNPGERCENSTCVLDCQAGLINCGGTCTNPMTDRTYCGASGDCTGGNAGTTCSAGEICDGMGTCALSCQAGRINCGGQCVDPLSDRQYCGATGNCTGGNAGAACADGQVCDGANGCQLSCQMGLVECGGTCINPLNDRAYCGASGDCLTTNAGVACNPGEICDGSGSCEANCQAGWIVCGGACVDPDSDRRFCGASGDCLAGNAGTACAANEVCNGSGMCAPGCEMGFLDCGGTCIDPLTNPTFCGASGDCTAGNAGMVCQRYEQCQAGSCEGIATYAGSLTPSNGYWNYGAVLGVPGADSECDVHYPRTYACAATDLATAGAAGELRNPTDNNGSPVASWWWLDSGATGPQLCAGASGDWTYGTGHLGCSGYSVSVAPMAGTLGVPALGACSASNHVACCR